ncbi:MAG: endo alpha-1,4 polygalactosaminidase [bacterium]
MKKTIGLSCILLILSLFQGECLAFGALSGVRSWLCFYGSAFPKTKVRAYDLYIFQPASHPDLTPLKENGGKTLGYISVGEINKSEPNFKKISDEGLLLEENKDWPGSFRVDMRSSRWLEFILAELIPEILSQGFDGIFIDTIDVAEYLEGTKKMDGAVQKAAQLIKEIRKRYPSIAIVQNNGLFLLDEVGESIDALAVEDVFTTYDFKKRRYEPAAPQWTEERISRLKLFQTRFDKPVLSLDYLKSSNTKEINAISKKARDEGFVPYIAEIGLDKIFFHP